MRKIKEVLRLKHELGLGMRQIARSCNISHPTVAGYLERFEKSGLSWPLPQEMDDDALAGLLFPPELKTGGRPLPNMEHIRKELGRKGVTLMLLWEEYKADCPSGYQYSQFCEHYRKWKRGLQVCMRQEYKAGEKMFSDWAGQTIPLVCPHTGEKSEAHLFVACLGASNYTYAQAFATEKLECWIEGHVRAYEYFGGVPEITTPDNAKTGVTRACRYEPDLNPTFAEMAEHYGTAVIPARPKSPRDKAKVEAAVLIAERWILAALRNHVFFGLQQLGAAISEKLREFNLRPLQKLGVSRRELYETLDAPALLPLPPKRYEFALWGKGRVGIDYHIEVERHFYSAPYTLARQEVEWRLSAGSVEILHRGVRVAGHPRSFRRGGYTTDPAHMPEAHRRHLEWTPERIIRWAETMGEGCREVVCRILASKPHPQQGFRACLGVLRLAGKHDPARMEAACAEAIRKDACSFQGIKSILARMPEEPEEQEQFPLPPCENVRGSAYYQEAPVN